jgi:2,3-bisphosphoglycerate-dependent phosphoglycerate mutase
MKKILTTSIPFKLLFICLLLSNYNAFAQKTTIYIVRHAEKAATPADDPALSRLGERRAQDLLKLLKKRKIALVYVTKYQRTALTAKPVTDQFNIVPEVYTTIDRAIATKMYQSFKGQNVLIVGHSNTIVPIIMAFCNIRPFGQLDDADYDMLFKITIEDGKAELEISNYGAVHHVTLIPEQYASDINNHFTTPPGRF